MCFSWKDYLQGNNNDSDKINLGLHEFGHALRFNAIKGYDSDYFFENYFPKWVTCASKEFMNLRNHQESIFRKYGSVNINEFFSVAIETFFEQPENFKKILPELFNQTSILLNQTYTNDGVWLINCRELLMSGERFSLSNNFESAFKYNFPANGFFVGAMGFLFIGLFALPKGGYLYPPPYICFLISLFFWAQLEKRYTRLMFSKTSFMIEKGFLFLKGYRKATLPGSCMISIIGSYIDHLDDSGHVVKRSCSSTLTYYKNNSFYEEELEFEVNQPEFDQLCKELKQNSVHVFISN